jgi:small conductance mechanosensitive channel
MNISEYLDPIVQWLGSVGLRILIIIVIALIAMWLLKKLTFRLVKTFSREGKSDAYYKRLNTLKGVTGNIVTVAVLAVALFTILGELGIALGPILTAAGVIGVAIGFGSQQLVQDVLSGFFILLEDQIRVGDVVNVAGQGGLVERVTLRMTVLRDLGGNVHYIRNGQIGVITNMTHIFSYALMDIGVAYRENVDTVMEVIKEVAATMRGDDSALKDDILDDIEILGVDKFADSAVIIKARIKTKPIKQWSVMREFNRRLKVTFDEKNIEIPFPHVTLYMGEDKDGSAPPMQVKMLNGSQLAKAEAEG